MAQQEFVRASGYHKASHWIWEVGDSLLRDKEQLSAEFMASAESPLSVFPGCDEVPSRAHRICWLPHMLIQTSMHQFLPSRENRNRSRRLTERNLNVRNTNVLKRAAGAKQEKLAYPKISSYIQLPPHLELGDKKENDFPQSPWTLCHWDCFSCDTATWAAPQDPYSSAPLVSEFFPKLHIAVGITTVTALAASVADVVADATVVIDAGKTHGYGPSFTPVFPLDDSWPVRDSAKCLFQSSHYCGKEKGMYAAER